MPKDLVDISIQKKDTNQTFEPKYCSKVIDANQNYDNAFQNSRRFPRLAIQKQLQNDLPLETNVVKEEEREASV